MPAFISFWHCIGALKYIINRVLFIAVVPKRVDTKYYIYFSFLLTCINIDRSEAKTRNSYSESEIFDTRRDKEGRWPWEMVIIMLNVVPTKKKYHLHHFFLFFTFPQTTLCVVSHSTIDSFLRMQLMITYSGNPGLLLWHFMGLSNVNVTCESFNNLLTTHK